VTTLPPDGLSASLADRYTIERELGRGGMATVYLARDLKHDRPVALKVLHPDLAASLGPERFRREITVAARLQHPHILSVHDSGETPAAQLWFTMPFVEGESLRERIRRERQLPLDEAVRIAYEAALALHYAHEHGIVHRDIKPENILLAKDGSTLVADFGIARVVGTATSGTGEALTATGMVVGTPQYMSPEQAAGERDVGPRSDVYSLGAVTFEMLAGEPPFTGPTTQAVVAKMLSGEPPSVRRSRPAVPESVDLTIRRALSPVPADRFASALDFARTLASAERGTMAAGGKPLRAGRGQRLSASILLVIATIAAAGGVYAWRRHSAAPAPIPPTVAGPRGVAVLPFDNVGDSANAYFADGITGEIRGKLSTLPSLRVVATASSNQYRHTDKPPDVIARELGVRYLLTGTVEWERGANGSRRVRVSPELIDVADAAAPATRWRQSYDTTLADVFDVQSAVATRVADKLGVVLSPPAQTQLATRPTQNLAAYDAYLRSMSFTELDHLSLRRALAAAEQAVALDSGFAQAWARVADIHATLYLTTVPTQADVVGAHDAAERAVALAPGVSDGYNARGIYDLLVAHDVTGALAAQQMAVQLAPSSASAITQLAYSKAALGQWPAAIEESRLAATLDPRSASAAGGLSGLLVDFRQYREARSEAERGLAFAPGDLNLIDIRAVSMLAEGNIAGAHGALRDVPPELDRARLIVYVTTRWPDMYWALDSADRRQALTAMGAAAFDNDAGQWGLARSQLHWLSGGAVRSRAYADSAQTAFEAQIRAGPETGFQHLYRGVALAALGQGTAAVQEGERGFQMSLATNDQYLNIPIARHLLAQIYAMTGQRARAIGELDTLLSTPYFVSRAWLRADPTWTPLRADPAFQRLLTTPGP
jgi:TolB-like protein/tetratricopeptide (TPR) repeat protein